MLGAEVDRAARTVRHAATPPRSASTRWAWTRQSSAPGRRPTTYKPTSARCQRPLRGQRLIVRIDRTELSKNIVRGLAAYRELLITQPQWRGRVTHLAFAYPSRHDLPEYREYTASVQRMAREIVDEFGTEDWNPLVLQVNDDYARSLAAYRLADVLLVNPIRDGMNLVAKEGPLLSRRDCALVLSREAGAAAELAEGALLVNPYDVTATAQALHEALCMPDAERQRRGALLTEASAACPPAEWFAAQLSALETGGSGQGAGQRSQQRGDSFRAVDDQVGLAGQRGDLSRGAAHRHARSARQRAPPAPRRRRAGRRGRRRRTGLPGSPFSNKSGESGALVDSARAQLDDQPSRFGVQPGRIGQRGERPGQELLSRPVGSAVRRVCTASAWPLSSIQVPSGAPALARTPGSWARASATPGGGGGEDSSPSCQRSQP